MGTWEEGRLVRRILIIDDDPQIRSLLRSLFEREGYAVAEGANGEEGLKVYRKNPADVVVTDLIMPEREGIETIIEFRRRFPQVKIIAMSGGGFIAGEEYLLLAQKVGALRTLIKPFMVNEVLSIVQELLRT
jgi:DNA-binding NtrC family response regulator